MSDLCSWDAVIFTTGMKNDFEYIFTAISYTNEAGDPTKIRSTGPLFPFFSGAELGIFLSMWEGKKILDFLM